MIIPNRIRLSTNVTKKLQYIKTKTGVTPNVLARIALMKALEGEGSIDNASVADSEGQELNRDVLFGEHVQSYNLLLTQYIADRGTGKKPAEIISALIEIGTHKIGHARSVQDLVS